MTYTFKHQLYRFASYFGKVFSNFDHGSIYHNNNYHETVRLSKYIYHDSGYNVDFSFDYTNDMVKAIFVCSDHFSNPNISHSK